jgi:hypothetical protein
MPTLGDGTVIPSHLEIETTPGYSAGDAFSNLKLRFGEVQKITYPNDSNSKTKQFIEYDVYVQERSHGTGNGRLYKHCLMINPFAGIADKAVWTLRGSNSIANSKKKRRGHGSKVLILCVNGETSNAVIIGGLRDQDDKTETNANNQKHHLQAVFNGVSFSINDDGEFTITFNGPTDIDGNLRSGVNQSNVGASISFTKDGKLKIQENQALEIGKATDHFVLGDTYRNAEHQMNQALQTGIQNVSIKLAAAGAQLALAGGSMVIPITGAVAAAPQITAASAQILAAIADLAKMAAAIQTFEAQANKYLSSKNKTD